MYIVHIVIKTCSFYLISIILLGILLAQDAPSTNIEDDVIVDKTDQIIKILQSIPQYSGNLNIGPLELKPSFEITETFNDNVFGASNDKVGDFYATYKPGLSVSLPFRKHRLSIGYGAEIFNYLRIQERNHFNHRLSGALDFNFYNGFSIRLSDTISSIRRPGGITRRKNPTVLFEGDVLDEPEDPEIPEEFTFNSFTNRKDITTNVASIMIDLPNFFNKFDFQLYYSNRDVKYQRERQEVYRLPRDPTTVNDLFPTGRLMRPIRPIDFDEVERQKQVVSGNEDSERNDDTFGVTVLIKPLPKIRIRTGFEYKVFRYATRKEKDSTFQRIPFDILWQATKKSSFFINSSLNIRDYGNDGIFKDFHGWDVTLGYRFNITERDNLTVKLERSLDEQQFRVNQLILPGESSPVLVGDDNPSFFTQINFDYKHRFTQNFLLQFEPYYQDRRFREKVNVVLEDGELDTLRKEKISTIGVNISAKYTAPKKWLFGEVSYSYQDRKSNQAGGDLVRNMGKISVGISF